MVDRVGQQLGKYRFVSLLGQGGFGEVWKAFDSQLHRYVAIKQLHADLPSDPDVISRFKREVLFIASLSHPNIVKIHDFQLVHDPDSETTTAYMVMDYIEGPTLADYIRNTSRNGQFPAADDIVYIFTAISLAIDYAHEKGMIHRDIKPANIMLDQRPPRRNPIGEPILTDFGIADMTKVLGNPLYVSPEQAQGLVGDKRSDMYSLGIILYEMTTGVAPFRSDSLMVILMQHFKDPPTPPALINPNLPPAISEMILKSIAKDPEARFQSASAMATALADAFNNPNSTKLHPPEVFFSYAHQDKGLRDRLENHLSNLKYRGLITTWHDREIQAGEEWTRQIDIYLDKAHIILLLISSDFMASQYCYGIEMMRALERHERREADVIPILLRPVLYTDAPFAKLQMLPTNGKPVVNWRNRDSAFVDIALGIEGIVQKRLERLTSAPPRQSVELPYSGPNIYPTSLASSQLLPAPSLPSPPPATARSISRRGSLILVILVVLSFLGLLSAGVLLLVHHPSFIPFVGVIVGSLILLAGILLVIRALVKKAQSRASRRRWRELEETRRRELEEVWRRERERTYYENALAAYEQALRQNNTDATAYRGKGNALVGLGRYDEALTAFEQVVVITPLPTAYVSMGNVLATLGRRDEAVTAYEQALALDASYASAYAGMSEALLLLGRTQEAEHMRERARQLGYEE